jgi:hypothetical protein
MRSTSPEFGSRRTRTFFALMPVYVYLGNGSYESRWLERVTVVEVFKRGRLTHGFWSTEEFVG